MANARVSVSKSGGLGTVVWRISIATYLIAIGVMGINKKGDIYGIFYRMFGDNRDVRDVFIVITAIVALIAGVAVLLELFNVKISYMDTLLFIIAIVWIVFVVIEVISLIAAKTKPDFWLSLQGLAIRFLILGSLMIASKRFDK